MSIIYFPKIHSFLSLHDHPKMSVLSRLMDGEIKRISLNLTNPDDVYNMSGGSFDNELIKK